jgi:hypothetical protein
MKTEGDQVMGDREIRLEFTCAECGKSVVVTSEEKLFLIVNTQSVAEGQQLVCDDCNDL